MENSVIEFDYELKPYQTLNANWYPSYMDLVNQSVIKVKEQLFVQIMEQVLQRTPQADDAKQVTIASHHDWPQVELVAYGGTVLGAIITELPLDEYRVKITFRPDIKNFNQLCKNRL